MKRIRLVAWGGRPDDIQIGSAQDRRRVANQFRRQPSRDDWLERIARRLPGRPEFW